MRAVYIAVIFATTRNIIPSLPFPYLKSDNPPPQNGSKCHNESPQMKKFPKD